MGERNNPETGCLGKRQFNTQRECNQAVTGLNKNNKKRVKCYKCVTCNYYHYGQEFKKHTVKYQSFCTQRVYMLNFECSESLIVIDYGKDTERTICSIQNKYDCNWDYINTNSPKLTFSFQ